jgi:hypothetical protein
MGEGELELCLPSAMFGRGAGGEGKDLNLHWDDPVLILIKKCSEPSILLQFQS